MIISSSRLIKLPIAQLAREANGEIMQVAKSMAWQKF